MDDPCINCALLSQRDAYFRFLRAREPQPSGGKPDFLEQHFRELYDRARVPLYRARISDGSLLECNEAMARLLGYDTKHECLLQYSAEAHWADLSCRHLLLEVLKANKEVDNYQIELRRRDGSAVWVELSAAFYAEQGYIEGILFDITAAKVLSTAERPIFELLVEGKSNKEIARLLNRSVRTVEDHRAHIMHKLRVGNLVELVQMTGSLPHEKTSGGDIPRNHI